MKKKRVKIITFHNAINHGAVIQAYALMKTVEQLGFQVEVVNYRPNFMRKDYLSYEKKPLAFLKKIVQYFIFTLFCRKYLHLTKRTYLNEKDLFGHPIESDYFICGSDQIWNLKITNQIDSAYFLTFPTREAIKIAYAVSMGRTEIPDISKQDFRSAISKFHYLSAREKFTRDQIICCRADTSVPILLDPSLLPLDYSDIMPLGKIKKEYIAVYFVLRDMELEKAAIKLKDILNLPLINLSSYRFKEADRNEYFINPGEWLRKIKCATLICTNSFHGTALSIHFGKRFYSISLRGKSAGLNNRLFELLDSLKLNDRLIFASEDIPDDKDAILENVNFENAHKLLKEKQQDSIGYLKNALGYRNHER